ncbi:hypothetical protein [Ruegeria sp.]|uniref:hypothetical protein n=1 Tax=Ruegeria sp. TaxID=1879320 RepID=UPI0023289C63|nr:hypothetical protein [Ruegeria sp.]MDA7963059.1 hypothetical protein [Ruegeria sp.]
MRSTALVIFLFLFASGAAAQACSLTALKENFEKLVVEKSCAFSKGGRKKYDTFSGEPVIDLGNGHIAQKLITGTNCMSRLNLFVSDCSTGQGIVVFGKRVGPVKKSDESGHKTVSSAQGPDATIDLLQEPLGPLGLNSQTTLLDVRRTSIEHNYRAETNLRWFFSRHETRKRIDYTCGCKLYYPDSPGAKL